MVCIKTNTSNYIVITFLNGTMTLFILDFPV